MAGCGPETVCIDHVIDGDTVILDNRERVRITGIDAPELEEPSGYVARQEAQMLLDGRCLEFVPGRSRTTGGRRGHYGRLIGDFRLPDGRLFSEYMIANGHAVKFK